ncbi:MAG: GAF domain-containing protein [Chloroflexi bacterium]|nr:GAF domain-containing protein [Chloroflexota bacterium]
MPYLDLIQMAALYDTGEALHASLELAEVLNQAATLGGRLMRARQCALFLFGERDTGLRFHATPELPPGAEAIFAPLLDELKQTGQMVNILNGQADSRWAALEVGPILIAPLRANDKMLGALYAGKAVDGQPFTEGDLNLLEAFAAQAARAIGNAQLYSLLPHLRTR